MPRKKRYTPGLGEKIARLIEEGHSIKGIARMPDMPSHETIFSWLRDPKHPFSDRHARARAIQSVAIMDLVLDTAKAVLAGTVQPGPAKVAGNQFMHLAKCYHPSLFGDRTQIDQNVKGGIVAQLQIVPPAETKEQWLQREQQALDQIDLEGEENGTS